MYIHTPFYLFYLEVKIGSKKNCSRKIELNRSSWTNHRAHLRLYFPSSLETIKPNMQYFINFLRPQLGEQWS